MAGHRALLCWEEEWRKIEMKNEAKMLPIRSEDSLTIPLYHLSQGKIKTFPKGANMGQTKYKLKGKILKAEKTSALGTNSKCFSCVNSVASSNKLTSHLVLFCPYYNTETEAMRTCSRS